VLYPGVNLDFHRIPSRIRRCFDKDCSFEVETTELPDSAKSVMRQLLDRGGNTVVPLVLPVLAPHSSPSFRPKTEVSAPSVASQDQEITLSYLNVSTCVASPLIADIKQQ
jgi:hypothetical protein